VVPVSTTVLGLAIEALQERTRAACADELIGLLAKWLRVQDEPIDLSVSPHQGVWRYQDVARAGMAVALGSHPETFVAGLAWLSERRFFLPNRTPGLEGDPLAILAIAIGLTARPEALESRLWFRDLSNQAAAQETDQWRRSMFAAAVSLAGGDRWQEVTADLVVALEGRGLAMSTAEHRTAALKAALEFGGDPDERSVVKLAALRQLLAFEATMDLQRPVIGDVSRVLRGVPAALKRWPWEDKPRTKREGVKAQQWDLPSEYHVQALLWALLRPVFADLKDEEYLKSIGYKHPRVDLAIPSLRLIVEVKFLYEATQSARAAITEEAAADTVLYLSRDNGYDQILVFVWDSKGAVQHHEALATGLREFNGVVDAIVVARPGAW
jgi:hypothetical protein